MNRILNNLYTLATILIIVGALLIFQDDSKGIVVLTVGILCNVIYRLFNLKWSDIVRFQLMEFLRVVNIVFLLFSLIVFFMEWSEKIDYLGISPKSWV